MRPHFVLEENFEPSVLLAENPTDARVWVFVRENGPHRAELHFRGPFGQRFLRRELALPRGLDDEVGRELIAQVVDSSTATLLHSSAGMSRDEIRADLAREQRAPSARAEPGNGEGTRPRASPTSPPARLEFELGARGAVQWAGGGLGYALGAGALGGVRMLAPSGLFAGARLTLETWSPQSLETSRLTATLRNTSLRAGLDIGRKAGHHGLSLGMSGGVDLVRISPSSVRDASLVLESESVDTVAVARGELRYELSLSSLRLTASLFADASFARTHYDVTDGGARVALATPWWVRPGLVLGVGWAPTSSLP